MLKHFTAFALCGMLVSGCVPGAVLVSPEIQITALDAHTRQPISGASASVVERDSTAYPQTLASGGTDAQGRFLLPARHKFGWVLIYGDPISSEIFDVQIVKIGYQGYYQSYRYNVYVQSTAIHVDAALESEPPSARARNF